MAKLKAPLMSLGARGQLGKSLVFFPWKGIDAVREYVVPANPRSAGQVAQRGYLEDAVDEWHGATYSAADVSAWNRLAGVSAKIMSGFNRMCQEFVNEIILGNVWTRLHLCSFSGVGTTGFTANIDRGACVHLPTVHWGTSKTHFPNSAVMADAGGGMFTYDIPSLTANTLYYVYFHVGFTAELFGRTGIYSQRTNA